MKRNISILSACLLSIFIFCLTSWALNKPVKEPNVSGSFYPASKAKLSGMIDKYLTSAKLLKTIGHVYGIISPHAGYVYSGSIAALGYKQIQGKRYRTVIIISPSHHKFLDSIAIYKNGFFKTPLGLVSVDTEFTDKLLTLSRKIKYLPDAFEKEHALEVQLPFLQITLEDFSIVPVIISSDSYALCQELSRALAKTIGTREDVLIVASSDMSHFHNQTEAKAIDAETLSIIQENDPMKLFENISAKQCELCGGGAVITLMLTMKTLGIDNIELLRYATSADTTNSTKDKVVGYSSFIFWKPQKKTTEPNNKKEKDEMLTDAQKKELIAVARRAIIDFVKDRKRQQLHTDDPLFSEHRGAFVTIKKNGHLRGCIGRIVADKPLINVIDEMAIQAATGDPRFPAVKPDELDKLDLEISVLSPLEEVSDIGSISVGKHGLIIQKGYHSGLLLPQVATEYGWTREEFLAHTCIKAGLGPDEWKTGAKIITFTADVFQEKD